MILLTPDQISLAPPGSEWDGHGWALPGTGTPWQGPGALQLQPGLSAPGADQGGGGGPFAPHATGLGSLYLPPDAPALEGCLVHARGEVYRLSQVRLVRDPTGSGGLDCWAAAVTSVAWSQ